MQLSKRDEKLLSRFLQLRRKPPTVGGLLRLNARVLLKFVALIALAISLAWWRGALFFMAGLVGFAAATLLLALIRINISVSRWPLTERITNWQEIERLLSDERQA